MTEVTQCPECGTRFKVTNAQLAAHEGLVRCGRCHEVFDASKHLHDDEPSPQLSLPIEPEPQLEELQGGAQADITPAHDVPGQEDEPSTLAQQVQFIEELTDEVLPPLQSTPDWVGIILAVLLSLALLTQGTYYYRVELAAQLPGIKPLLQKYCGLLACTVPLPREVELISIESSELASEPNRANIITLTALLHNRAPYAQAYPSLELTLNDLQDNPVARKVFAPADYLKPGTDEQAGIPPNRDLDIRLRMDTTDLKPTGYRLFLFYPK